MPTQEDVRAGSAPPLLASTLGTSFRDTISAAGTNQATATVLMGSGANNVTTVASGTGVILQPAQSQPNTPIWNAGVNPLTIYPAVGERFGNLAANASVTLAPNKGAVFFSCGQRWIPIISA